MAEKRIIFIISLAINVRLVLCTLQGPDKAKSFKVNLKQQNLEAPVIKTVTTPSRLTCLHRCKLQDGCNSINYNTKTKQCELLAPGVAKKRFKDSESDKNHWINANSIEDCKESSIQDESDGACPILYIKEDIKIAQNKLLTTIPIWSPSWKIAFNLITFGPDDGTDFTNILHFTVGGNNLQYGDRIPSFFFFPRTTHPYVCASLNSIINSCYEPKYSLIKNTNVRYEFSQRYVSEGRYRYTITVNDTLKYSIINNDAPQLYNVKVYTGDPWHAPAKAVVSELAIVNFL